MRALVGRGSAEGPGGAPWLRQTALVSPEGPGPGSASCLALVSKPLRLETLAGAEAAQLPGGESEVLIYAFREIFLYALCNF